MAGKFLLGVMVGCMTALSTWAAPGESANAVGHAMVGSKHDLTGLDRRAGTGAMVGVAFDNCGNLCVYCHTQHANQKKAGGPPLYAERFGHPRLRQKHLPFPIGEAERDAWMLCMTRALEEVVPDDSFRAQLTQAFFKTADFMRNR